jgi:hypothetical protein
MKLHGVKTITDSLRVMGVRDKARLLVRLATIMEATTTIMAPDLSALQETSLVLPVEA